MLYRYPLPDIPPGWKPDPERVWSQNQGQGNPDKENVKQNDSMSHEKWKASTLSAEQVRFIIPAVLDKSVTYNSEARY